VISIFYNLKINW